MEAGEDVSVHGAKPDGAWVVYMLRCGDGSIYTGITTDVERRLEQHRSGRGAKSLRGKGPLEIAARCSVVNRSEASRLEYAIKQLSHAEKQAIVNGSTPMWRAVVGM